MADTAGIRSQLKFGFEYETIVEADDMYRELEAEYNTIRESEGFRDICNGVLVTEPKITDADIANLTEEERNNPKIMEFIEAAENLKTTEWDMHDMFLLGALYNETSHTNMVRFEHAAITEGENCKTFRIVDAPPDKQDKKKMIRDEMIPYPDASKKWLITYDTSVTMGDGFPLYYSLLEHTKQQGSAPNPTNRLIEMIEVVSPILSYNDLKKGVLTNTIGNVFLADGHLKYWNNTKTSNHVHMSYGGNDIPIHELITKLCFAWWYFEPVFLLLVGYWRRNNAYCLPMRNVVKLPSELFFANAGDVRDASKIVEFLRPTFPALASAVDEIRRRPDAVGDETLAIIYALVMLFQGDIEDRNSRYAAFNMLNLRKDGIQTVEVRIKQGSADPQENTMFVQLLGCFMESVITRPIVTDQYDTEFKTLLWNMYNNLKSSETWTTQTSVTLIPDYCKVIDEFMTYIKDTSVRNYWIRMIKNLHGDCPVTGGATKRKASASPSLSFSPAFPVSTPKSRTRSAFKLTRTDSDKQVTSFGTINYAKMRKEIKYDPVYQRIKRALQQDLGQVPVSMKVPSKRMTKTSTAMPISKMPSAIAITPTTPEMTISAYGGKNTSKKSTRKTKQ